MPFSNYDATLFLPFFSNCWMLCRLILLNVLISVMLIRGVFYRNKWDLKFCFIFQASEINIGELLLGLWPAFTSRHPTWSLIFLRFVDYKNLSIDDLMCFYFTKINIITIYWIFYFRCTCFSLLVWFVARFISTIGIFCNIYI